VRIIPILIALFIITPFVELFLLLQLAEATSWQVALLTVIVTGIIGGLLARQQGTMVLRRIRATLAQGKMPADVLLDGALILVGGVSLITPGLLTDAAGFILLIPFTRKHLKSWLKKRFASKFHIITPEPRYRDIEFEVKDDQQKQDE